MKTMPKALVLHQENGTVSTTIEELDESRLPAGDVEIAVAYSSLNYKDGMILNGLGGLVKTYPHVPALTSPAPSFTGQSDQFQPGDQVICTGWRVGEIHWGGYAQKARLKADWLVPLPAGLTMRTAMGLGAAGLTAAISLEALEAHGLAPDKGEVLVTGAAGGVGSLSVLLLSSLGYQVAASTGRPETRTLSKRSRCPNHHPAPGPRRAIQQTLGKCALGRLHRLGRRHHLGPRLGPDELRGFRRCRGLSRRCPTHNHCHPLLAAQRQHPRHRLRILPRRAPRCRLGAP